MRFTATVKVKFKVRPSSSWPAAFYPTCQSYGNLTNKKGHQQTHSTAERVKSRSVWASVLSLQRRRDDIR